MGRKSTRDHLKSFFGAIIYIFTNYFVAYIPCWHIRKLFYILMGMKIGKSSRINMKVIVWYPWKIRIGEHTIVNEFTLLDGRGGLDIGDSCSLAMWSIVYTASHYSSSESFQYYTKKTTIGNCCWICARAIILPGSKLNDRTIISAGSVFAGESEQAGIYCGNPANKVKERNVLENYVLYGSTHLK